MDFTPTMYYLKKAKIWWRMNKHRPEYRPAEKHLQQRYTDSEPKKQIQEGDLRMQVTQLQNTDFLVWGKTFNELFEFGLEHESTRIKTLLENASVSQVDVVYTEILMRLIEYYNGKKNDI
jgi:bacterioferritin (cytochrome b1)